MARVCIVSVILPDEGRKLICCFLCLYLQPVEANRLWAVALLTSTRCMLAWNKVLSLSCSVLLPINICMTSWLSHMGDIILSLNNVMKSIFETSCWPGKLQDVLPVQVLTVIYFHMRIPDKQPVIIFVSSLTGPSHTDHGVLLLRRPCTVPALLVYTTPNKAGCGWWWLIAGTTIHSILCLYRFCWFKHKSILCTYFLFWILNLMCWLGVQPHSIMMMAVHMQGCAGIKKKKSQGPLLWLPLCPLTHQCISITEIVALWRTNSSLCHDNNWLPVCKSLQSPCKSFPWISWWELGRDWLAHLCEVATCWRLSGISLSSSGSRFSGVFCFAACASLPFHTPLKIGALH